MTLGLHRQYSTILGNCYKYLIHLTYKGQNKLAQRLCLNPGRGETSVVATRNQKRSRHIHKRQPVPLAAAPADVSSRSEIPEGHTSVSQIAPGADDDSSWTKVTYNHRAARRHTPRDVPPVMQHSDSRPGAWVRPPPRASSNVGLDYHHGDQEDSRRTSLQPRTNGFQREPCSNCGENHHNVAKCRYSYRLDCRICGYLGHKAKHHNNDMY